MNAAETIKTFTLANEFKEGDLPLGGTSDDHQRAEARREISRMTAAEITRTVFVEDSITETLSANLDRILLKEIAGLTVADNQPYFVSDDTDYSIPYHGEARGLPHVEIEIRQDLLLHEAGQREWAQRITRALQDAEQAYFGKHT